MKLTLRALPDSIMMKRLLIVLLIVSVLIRTIVALIMGDQIVELPAISDQISYHSLATRVLGGHGFTFDYNWWPLTRAGEPTAHWSYLYTLYLTLVYALFGIHPLAARLIQVTIVGLLMPWLAYRLAQYVFRIRQAETEEARAPRFARLEPLNQLWQTGFQLIPLLAAAWVAVYGYFIYFSAALMTESFYILGVMWTLDCAFRIALPKGSSKVAAPVATLSERQMDADYRSWRRWLELGLAIGLTSMLRQVFLPFIPCLFLWLWWVRYRQVREHPRARTHALRVSLLQAVQGAALSILVITVLIAPITTYNYQRFNRCVLLNTNAGYAFYLSNHPSYGNNYEPMLTSTEFKNMIPKDIRWMDEAALDQELLKQGIGFVIADPWRYFRLSIDRIPYFFTFWPLSTSSVVSNVNRALSYGLAFLFIISGIALWFVDTRRKRVSIEPGTLLLVFCGVYSMLHMLSWAAMRYRLPVDAVALVFAARGFYAVGLAILFKKPQKSSGSNMTP
jgi:hypothetical protein